MTNRTLKLRIDIPDSAHKLSIERGLNLDFSNLSDSAWIRLIALVGPKTLASTRKFRSSESIILFLFDPDLAESFIFLSEGRDLLLAHSANTSELHVRFEFVNGSNLGLELEVFFVASKRELLLDSVTDISSQKDRFKGPRAHVFLSAHGFYNGIEYDGPIFCHQGSTYIPSGGHVRVQSLLEEISKASKSTDKCLGVFRNENQSFLEGKMSYFYNWWIHEGCPTHFWLEEESPAQSAVVTLLVMSIGPQSVQLCAESSEISPLYSRLCQNLGLPPIRLNCKTPCSFTAKLPKLLLDEIEMSKLAAELRQTHAIPEGLQMGLRASRSTRID